MNRDTLKPGEYRATVKNDCWLGFTLQLDGTVFFHSWRGRNSGVYRANLSWYKSMQDLIDKGELKYESGN